MNAVKLVCLGLVAGWSLFNTAAHGAGPNAATLPHVIHHQLSIRVEPQDGSLQGRDRVRLTRTGPLKPYYFWLHHSLEPSSPTAGVNLREVTPVLARSALRRFRLDISRGIVDVLLRYQGSLASAGGQRELPQTAGRGSGQVSVDAARSYAAGYIGPKGIYLPQAGGWYPQFEVDLVTARVDVDLPEGWLAVGFGVSMRSEAGLGRQVQTWTVDAPQTGLVLVANRFTRYQKLAGNVLAEVYLRQPDAPLAQRYLDASVRYLKFYADLLGAYPYTSFAVVENFWETGYGFASFTLLGPRVLRLPFIVHTSLPHEIAHNWFGNGVYVDHSEGNWSEGLTAYLADYLFAEARGGGSAQRRATLQKYRSYVGKSADFSLSRFHGKHGEASEAVGYGKALMFFHLLRRKLGDAAFVAGLRQVYVKHRFGLASYADLRAAFERASGMPLELVFKQWTQRAGAPHLALGPVQVQAGLAPGTFRLNLRIRQLQADRPYTLSVPLAVQLAGEPFARRETIAVVGPETEVVLKLPARPVRVALDPEFDLFRVLDVSEIPPSMGELMGGAAPIAVLPAGASARLRERYSDLARSLGASVTIDDTSLLELPSHAPVWVMGWGNAHRPAFESFLGSQSPVSGARTLRLESQSYSAQSHCVVLAARRPASTAIAAASVGWAGCERARAMPGLARKLPHYGRYGYLAFQGDAPTNVLKGEWAVTKSQMVRTLAGASPRAPIRLRPLAPLAVQVGDPH